MANTRKKREMCLRFIIKTLERRHWRGSCVFIVNREHFSHLSSDSIADLEQVFVRKESSILLRVCLKYDNKEEGFSRYILLPGRPSRIKIIFPECLCLEVLARRLREFQSNETWLLIGRFLLKKVFLQFI